jgi:hypothetical protein
MVDGWALFFAWGQWVALLLLLAYFVLWRRPR